MPGSVDSVDSVDSVGRISSKKKGDKNKAEIVTNQKMLLFRKTERNQNIGKPLTRRVSEAEPVAVSIFFFKSATVMESSVSIG